MSKNRLTREKPGPKKKPEKERKKVRVVFLLNEGEMNIAEKACHPEKVNEVARRVFMKYARKKVSRGKN